MKKTRKHIIGIGDLVTRLSDFIIPKKDVGKIMSRLPGGLHVVR